MTTRKAPLTHAIKATLIEEVFHDDHVHSHCFTGGGIIIADLEAAVDFGQCSRSLTECKGLAEQYPHQNPVQLPHLVLDTLFHILKVGRRKLGQSVQLET